LCSLLTLSDYRPELARRKAEKEANAEAIKQAHMERMMRDMGMGSAAAAKANPFGPHYRNDRADAYMDYEGGAGSDSEDERIERQMEEEEEADHAPELGKQEVDDLEFGGNTGELNWRAP